MNDRIAVGSIEREGPPLRLASEQRRDQLLDVAAKIIVDQGFLPLPVERLARTAHVSKALIYAHFPTQYSLFNTLLARELNALAQNGLEEAARGTALDAVALDCVMLYFDHVVQWGPLLHILLSDLYLHGHHDSAAVRRRDLVVRSVARLARREVRLPAKEIIAAINMILAIPEEAGALAFHREVELPLAREICRTLTLSALKGLRSCERQTTPEWGF